MSKAKRPPKAVKKRPSTLGAPLPPELVQPEHLKAVRFVRPRTLVLTFADGLQSRLAIGRLGLPVDRMQWPTVEISQFGKAITLIGVKGDSVPIDSSTLRYLVDSKYAAKVDASLQQLQLTRSELRDLVGDSKPPVDWYNQPEQDLTRDSWK